MEGVSGDRGPWGGGRLKRVCQPQRQRVRQQILPPFVVTPLSSALEVQGTVRASRRRGPTNRSCVVRLRVGMARVLELLLMGMVAISACRMEPLRAAISACTAEPTRYTCPRVTRQRRLRCGSAAMGLATAASTATSWRDECAGDALPQGRWRRGYTGGSGCVSIGRGWGAGWESRAVALSAPMEEGRWCYAGRATTADDEPRFFHFLHHHRPRPCPARGDPSQRQQQRQHQRWQCQPLWEGLRDAMKETARVHGLLGDRLVLRGGRSGRGRSGLRSGSRGGGRRTSDRGGEGWRRGKG